jgi:hypothetical protein
MLSAQTRLDPATSNLLLTSVARACAWINDLSQSRINSFEEIARSESKVQRHIVRNLAPLAYVSPRSPKPLPAAHPPITVTMVARALLPSLADQEHKFGII